MTRKQTLDYELWSIHRGLGIPMGAARLALELYASDQPLSPSYLLIALPPERTDAERSGVIIRVWISQLRAAMGKDAIETTYGKGYTLSPAARLKLTAFLKPDKETV